MTITKKLLHFSGLLALSATLLMSCGQQESAPTFTVTFDSNGGSAVIAQKVEYGKKARRPAAPTKDGFTFDNWYADSYLTVDFDFTQAITADWTIYAGWLEGGDSSSSSTSQQPSTWQMTFVDASWWNDYAPSVNYTLDPASDGKGAFGTEKAAYDYVHGYKDGVNQWLINVPSDATKIQFFRATNDGTADGNARTVVIDLTSRGSSTKWVLSSTETWYNGNNLATGSWN